MEILCYRLTQMAVKMDSRNCGEDRVIRTDLSVINHSSSGSDLLGSALRQNRPAKHKPNEQSARRRKHCALAEVKQKQKIFSQTQSRSQAAGRPKFNQLEMVTTFTYRVWTYCSADMLYPASKIFFRQFAEVLPDDLTYSGVLSGKIGRPNTSRMNKALGVGNTVRWP